MESFLPPDDSAAPPSPPPPASPDDKRPHVSIRSIYEEALRDVMADPRKAIAELDPGLAALLGSLPAPVARP